MEERVEKLARFKEDTEPDLRDLQISRNITEKTISTLQAAVFDKKKEKEVLTTLVSPIHKRTCKRTTATTEMGLTDIYLEDIDLPQK